MWDLYAGMAIVMLVSAIVCLVCIRIFQRITPLARHLLLVAVILSIVPYVLWGRDDPLWAKYLPYSNLIVLSNLFPEFLAVMAAELWVLWPKFHSRRVGMMVMLSILAVLIMCLPVLRPTPFCDYKWEGNVCLQTSNATCSPAACATLLKHYDIDTTEEEMARLCLTDSQGSLWMGIYRGLTLMTKDRGYRVVVDNYTLEDLKELPGPFLLRSGLEVGAEVDPIYTEKWGWDPGQMHTVVLFRFLANDKAQIGDPSVGMEFWTEDNLRVLFHGQAMRLVKVDGTGSGSGDVGGE